MKTVEFSNVSSKPKKKKKWFRLSLLFYLSNDLIIYIVLSAV